MELTAQVTSLELSKRLKELGSFGAIEVSNYPGYWIDNKGNVYSTKYRAVRGLKFSESKGYLRVALSSGNRRKIFPVHRLVATAFLGNPELKPHVNHKDGNKQNNHVDNLEWCTASENMQHASKILKRPGGKTGYRFSNMYPSEALRNRLITLGIPRNRHNLAELGEMLPSRLYNKSEPAHQMHQLIAEKWPNGMWNAAYVCLQCKGNLKQVNAPTEADARALMLIYLLENNLITLPS